MKNKKILLLLLPLLLGCNSANNSTKKPASSSKVSSESTNTSTTSSSSKQQTTTIVPSSSSSSSVVVNPVVLDLETTLATLAQGVKVDVTGTEKYNDVTNNLNFRNTSKNKEFSFIQYRDDSREAAALHEYYTTKGDDNLVYSTRLNIRNEYTYYKVYNPVTYEWFTWDEGYNNPFLSLTVDSFEKVDEVTYALKADNVAAHSAELTNLLYGNPGLNLTAFTMYLENDNLNIEAFANFAGSTSYSYSFKAVVVESGEDTAMDYRALPYEEVEDAAFDEMLASLKAGNYTATIVDYDDGFEDNESLYLSNEDKIYYETYGYCSGYYQVDEETVQEVQKIDGDFYKVGSPLEGDISEVMPSFNLSRAVFDYANGVYTLKAGVEGDTGAFTVLETYAYDLDEFTITISEDGYEFRNVSGDYETVVTFTNIGSTDVGYTSDSVLEPLVATSWADVLDITGYMVLCNIAGEEVANAIPVPNGYDTWYQFSEEPEYAMLVALAGEEVYDDLFLYMLQLDEAGFLISEEEGINGGVMALAEVEVDGEDHVLVVEFLVYEEEVEFFCILVYIGE